MEIEDKRVGGVAEGVLYEFLPAAFDAIIPPCGDPRTELTHERCKLVASAALSVGALMNAPPTFLEFLLRIPWQKIEQLHRKAASSEWIQQQLEIPEELQRKLVNTPIHSSLMPTVLEFLFSESFQDSLPPQLKSEHDPIPQSHFDNVAALLDGAGPLHCAAIRGNPAQIDYLLYCGADPTQKTIPGDYPIQLVPFCGEKGTQSGQRVCRCMAKKDQEIWECRSATARLLIARKSCFHVGHGFVAWLTMVFLCILNALGLWGCSAQLPRRSVISRHVEHQKEVRATRARLEAQRLLNDMRKEARQGAQFLSTARQIPWNRPTGKQRSHDGSRSEEDTTEKAFLSYVHAVHFLQNLLLHNVGKDSSSKEVLVPALPKVNALDCQVVEDEQAEIYCCWAESVLLKFKSCRCAGCAAVAVQAIRMAHIRCGQLLSQLEKHSSSRSSDMGTTVGGNLMHVVYIHICLLLDTDALQSATKASMWRAEQCVKEWRRLEAKGFTFGSFDITQVIRLEKWVCEAESDLTLAEALYGDLLVPSQTVDEILSLTVARSAKDMPYLIRPVTLENVQSLEVALNKAKQPSSELTALTVEIMQNGKKEIQAAAKLKECLSTKVTPVVTGMIKKISEAIQEAERFPRLAKEASTARQLHQQLLKRAEAIERLEVIMMQAKRPIVPAAEASRHQDIDSTLIVERISALQVGIEQGKKARINTEKARKLLRELQAQMSAVESAHQLDAVMAKKPCGSAALKTALAKAEACYTSASGLLASNLIPMSAFLLPRMQNARKRLEIERVVESLNRATTTCTTVDDLSKLESIILDARKVFDQVGADESDYASYREARTLRGVLHNASKVRQQLQNGTKTLQKQQRKIDAIALEETIQQATPCLHLVQDNVGKAQQALDHWGSIQKIEEHLMEVIQDAEESSEVSKAVHEATNAGVKTQSAKKILKLMQNVEKAMEQLSGNTINITLVQSVIEEAEKGGAGQKFTARATTQLKDTQAAKAQDLLKLALEEDAGCTLTERCTKLRTALERAGSLVKSLSKSNSAAIRTVHIPEEDETVTEDSTKSAEDEQSEGLRSFWDSVTHVHEEIRRCEEEDLRIKRDEAEKERRALEMVLENERREKERQEAEKRELERKRKEKEESDMREQLLMEQERQKTELASQLSLEKQEKEKRAGFFRKALVDPKTNKELTQNTSPLTSPNHPSSSDDSLAMMEYQVQRLLGDESPEEKCEPTVPVSAAFVQPDPNRRVRGVLERLEDPWGVQSAAETQPLPLFGAEKQLSLPKLSSRSLNLGRDFVHRYQPPNLDPFEALLAQTRANKEAKLRAREARDFRFPMQQSISPFRQPRDPMLRCPPNNAPPMRRSTTLDSSAPAFYPPASAEALDFSKGVSVFSAPPQPPAPLNPPWAPTGRPEVARVGGTAEQPRTVEGPFPGVGVGIPGTPSRSLSERIDHRKLSRALSGKDTFSMSGEF